MATEQMIIVPSLVLGAAIGIYEALVIHRDVQIPTHRFGHMIHALLLSMLFVFISLNTSFFVSLFPALKGTFFGNVHIIRIAIGLIAAIKIHAVSAALKGAGTSSAGMKETWFHSLLIGALIAGVPYVYPMIKTVLPKWAQ